VLFRSPTEFTETPPNGRLGLFSVPVVFWKAFAVSTIAPLDSSDLLDLTVLPISSSGRSFPYSRNNDLQARYSP